MSMNYDIYDVIHGGDNDDIGDLITAINALTDTEVFGPYNFAEDGITEMKADIDDNTNFPDLTISGPYNLSDYDGRAALKTFIEALPIANVKSSLIVKDVKNNNSLGFIVSGTGTTLKDLIPFEFPHKNANIVIVVKDTGSSTYLGYRRWNTKDSAEAVAIMSS